MKTVILESPYANGLTPKVQNVEYARKALKDCIDRDESPFASHLLYTQALDDDNPKDRELGISLGYDWWPVADLIVFYTDLGWSDGMLRALRMAISLRKAFRIRSLKNEPQMPPVISDDATERLIASKLEKSK